MSEHPRQVTVVVGNPREGSRTAKAGTAVAERVVAHTGWPAEVGSVELAGLAGALFAWGDPSVGEAKATVLSADLVVVASPVFKASMPGLLKAFLDHFDRDELAAVPTVPVMIGAGAWHQLAVEQQLRPVLIEIGASCPTRGLYITEETLDQVPVQVDEWLAVWGTVLAGATEARVRAR